ncbi:MAG: carbohydrate kinase family protein [Propioniciclava sp.]
MSGIAVIGNAIVDYYKQVAVYPTQSSLTTITGIDAQPGGLLCNCAMGLARLDPDLRIPVVGRVGPDPGGDLLREHLGRYRGIDTTQLHLGGQTSFSDVMEDVSTKTRTFFHFRGANAELDLADIDLAALEADLLHIGYVLLLDRFDADDSDYGTRMARFLAEAQARGVRTSLDVVSEESDRYPTLVPPALRYVDYCLINEREAAATTGVDLGSGATPAEAGLRAAAAALLRMGVSTWVVIHWPGGAVGLSSEGEWVVRPAVAMLPEEIATTTGAGDAFASGVLHAAWSGRPLAAAVEAGMGTAACSLRDASSTGGIPDAAGVAEFYRDAAKCELWASA